MKLIYLFWLFIISLNSYSQALIPNPPQLSATSYLLLDAKTLKVISGTIQVNQLAWLVLQR